MSCIIPGARFALTRATRYHQLEFDLRLYLTHLDVGRQ
jgi:hypothetical protein